MKKVLLVGLLTSSMFFNTACTDDEVAAGVIGAAIGIGIVAAGNDHDHHDHHNDHHNNYPPPRYPGPDYGRPDYGRPGYGNGRGHGGPDYGRGPGRGSHRGYALEVNLATPFDTASANPEVLAFSKKYHVTVDAAAKIQSAFLAVESKGVAAFAAIGLDKGDLKDIMKREMPASSSLKSLATKLDISEAQSKDLIKDMIQEFDVQASNVESSYWQSCMAKGKWRTPQNLYCKNTSWNGCAPENGATLCY